MYTFRKRLQKLDPALSIMKRSTINQAIKQASNCFEKHHWSLPPSPLWDVTDFGLGKFEKFGLVLINLAEEAEYCEKLMFAFKNQVTPYHAHKQKKEDIIVRNGRLALLLSEGNPETVEAGVPFQVKVNGKLITAHNGEMIILEGGERITLTPGIYHEFFPLSNECIIGEVSTANDDVNDNFFVNEEIGRFSEIEEDEEPLVTLVSD